MFIAECLCAVTALSVVSSALIGEFVCSVDARSGSASSTVHWVNREVLGDRAHFQLPKKPSYTQHFTHSSTQHFLHTPLTTSQDRANYKDRRPQRNDVTFKESMHRVTVFPIPIRESVENLEAVALKDFSYEDASSPFTQQGEVYVGINPATHEAVHSGSRSKKVVRHIYSSPVIMKNIPVQKSRMLSVSLSNLYTNNTGQKNPHNNEDKIILMNKDKSRKKYQINTKSRKHNHHVQHFVVDLNGISDRREIYEHENSSEQFPSSEDYETGKKYLNKSLYDPANVTPLHFLLNKPGRNSEQRMQENGPALDRRSSHGIMNDDGAWLEDKIIEGPIKTGSVTTASYDNTGKHRTKKDVEYTMPSPRETSNSKFDTKYSADLTNWNNNQNVAIRNNENTNKLANEIRESNHDNFSKFVLHRRNLTSNSHSADTVIDRGNFYLSDKLEDNSYTVNDIPLVRWSVPRVSNSSESTNRFARNTVELAADPVYGVLILRQLQGTDGGIFHCRVDFREAPTRHSETHLTVIGES